MDITEKQNPKILSDPLEIYHSMLKDIEHATKYVYLETFRFENDPIGIKFINLLSKKAKQGLQIMLLVDAWGTSVSERFFKNLISNGGNVKFFKRIRLTINLISANHERDHRKLLVIDDKISYISSINISNYNLNWREFSLRLEGNISKVFQKVFLQNYNLKDTYKFDKKRHTQSLKYGEMQIVRDVPSVRITRIRKKLLQYIRKSREEILIESPYFLPTFFLRDALIKAAKRGVKVQIVMPRRSDVSVVNILRQRYLGRLHEEGVKIFYYLPSNLHSKIMIADENFYIGSANFDYRSFRYQFEIGLFGKNDDILQLLKSYSNETLGDCESFDYNEWKKRSRIHKTIEWLLIPFRHFL